MADLYVSFVGGVQYGVAKGPVGGTTLTTSATPSAKTAAAPASASVAIVVSSVAHWVNIGPQASVTATATNATFVPGGVQREFAINPGDAVAAITA